MCKSNEDEKRKSLPVMLTDDVLSYYSTHVKHCSTTNIPWMGSKCFMKTHTNGQEYLKMAVDPFFENVASSSDYSDVGVFWECFTKHMSLYKNWT